MSGQSAEVVQLRSTSAMPSVDSWDELPLLMRVRHLQQVLDLGETAAYALLNDLADAGVALRRGKKILLNRDRFRAWWESGDLKVAGS